MDTKKDPQVVQACECHSWTKPSNATFSRSQKQFYSHNSIRIFSTVLSSPNRISRQVAVSLPIYFRLGMDEDIAFQTNPEDDDVDSQRARSPISTAVIMLLLLLPQQHSPVLLLHSIFIGGSMARSTRMGLPSCIHPHKIMERKVVLVDSTSNKHVTKCSVVNVSPSMYRKSYYFDPFPHAWMFRRPIHQDLQKVSRLIYKSQPQQNQM